MLTEHHAHPEFIRLFTGAVMVVVGAVSLAWPRCAAGAAGNFTRWAARTHEDAQRLRSVVSAREGAEGISAAYGRYLGIAAIVLATLELFPWMPFAIPYALFCLATAMVSLLAYLQFRRATEQRVAPLVRRSPYEAMPPLLIASVACSLFAVIVIAIDSGERVGAIVVALATVVLGTIAWRIASTPALLLGSDLQYEYAVDERVRVGRARMVANLACAPAFILAVMSEPGLARYGALGSAAYWMATAAFAVSFVASIVPLLGRIRTA